jgi:hypothetical protein
MSERQRYRASARTPVSKKNDVRGLIEHLVPRAYEASLNVDRQSACGRAIDGILAAGKVQDKSSLRLLIDCARTRCAKRVRKRLCGSL